MPKECKAATNYLCLREFAKLGRWGGIWTRSYDTKQSRCECPRWRRKADRVMYMETKRYLKTLSKEKEKLGGEEGERRVHLLGVLCVTGPGGPCERGHAHSLLSPLLLSIADHSLIFQYPQCLAQIAPQICLRTYTVLVPKSIFQR